MMPALLGNVKPHGAAPAGIALVAQIGKALGQNGGVALPSIDTTGATLLIMGVASYYPNAIGAMNVGDSGGNTWYPLAAFHVGNFGNVQFFYAWNPTTSATHFFAATRTDSYCSFCVSAWSGVRTASDPFDLEAGDGSTAGSLTSFQCAAGVAPTLPDSLVVALCAGMDLRNTDPPPTVDSGFSLAVRADTDGVAFASFMGAKVSSGYENPTVGWTTPAASVNVALAVFAPA